MNGKQEGEGKREIKGEKREGKRKGRERNINMSIIDSLK